MNLLNLSIVIFCLAGLALSITTLSTNQWYNVEIKINPDSYSAIDALILRMADLKLSLYFGMWKVCILIGVLEYHEEFCMKTSDAYDFEETINAILDTAKEKVLGNLHQSLQSLYRNKRDLEIKLELNETETKYYVSLFQGMINPSYLQGLRSLEVLAVITGVLVIMVHGGFIVKKSFYPRTMHCLIVGLLVLTVCIHSIIIVVWAVEKNAETHDHYHNLLGILVKTQKHSEITSKFGWSWDIKIASAVIYTIASICSIRLQPPKKPDDEFPLDQNSNL